MTFTAGQMSATLMVSTMDDNSTELSEYFTLMIKSVGRPDVVSIGSPNTSVITVVDNDGVCVCLCVCVCMCVYFGAHESAMVVTGVHLHALTMSALVCNTFM